MGVPEVPASLRSWMSAVSEIVRSVNAAEPLAKVLTRVAEQACELIGFEFCAVMLADEDTLLVHRPRPDQGDYERLGWVKLVYGNDGWDVICDYTVPLEEQGHIVKSLELSRRLSGSA